MPATRRQTLAAAASLPLLGLRGARAATRDPGHLTMGISGWPATLAPWANAGTVAQNAKLLIYRGLLGYGPDGQMRGELAERWEHAADGSWVFHLRDAVFHNGAPVTADDVRYSIEQIAADKNTAYMKGEMSRISRIDTPDARTVRLTTAEPPWCCPGCSPATSRPSSRQAPSTGVAWHRRRAVRAGRAGARPLHRSQGVRPVLSPRPAQIAQRPPRLLRRREHPRGGAEGR